MRLARRPPVINPRRPAVRPGTRARDGHAHARHTRTQTHAHRNTHVHKRSHTCTRKRAHENTHSHPRRHAPRQHQRRRRRRGLVRSANDFITRPAAIAGPPHVIYIHCNSVIFYRISITRFALASGRARARRPYPRERLRRPSARGRRGGSRGRPGGALAPSRPRAAGEGAVV